MKRLLSSAFLLFLLICNVTKAIGQVMVSSDQHFLKTSDGKPFFWLGDTCWELFHRLTREEAAKFLEIRHQQGFNVIQAVALAEFDGIRQPNRYGDLPFIDEDPTKWATTPGNDPANAEAYDYWDHVDYIIQLAAAKGMYIGLLPTWGDKVAHLWGEGPIIFNAENARQYGYELAKRYANQWNIIWILGGDRPAVYKGNDGKEYDDRAIWRAMAEGIKAGEGERHQFMTYHPSGGPNSTSQYIHDESWLDMNAFQSGHGARETEVWNWVSRDRALTPTKPTIDLEPCYEDHPVNPWDGKWTRARGYFVAYDVRVRTYRSVFAGTCGVTYGHHQIWQFLNTKLYEPINIGDTIIGWERAAQAEGAWEMHHLKNLMLSRPYFTRIPDQSLIVFGGGNDWTNYVSATRDQNGAYAMIHLPENKPVTIDMTKISGPKKKAWWYDPRTGKAKAAKIAQPNAACTFQPPASGRDWVLVIDDASKKFAKPGVLK